MRTTVKIRQIFRNIKSQMLLIENLFMDLDIDTTKTYVLELKEIRSKRTLKQNKMMWALIRKIASHEDMQQEPEEIYVSALEEANLRSTYLLAPEEAEDELRKNFRAVKVVRPEQFKGREMIVYKCFLGSSKLNTKEMKQLIEIIKYWAEDLGIETNEEYFTE